jgi:hypothetical protein
MWVSIAWREKKLRAVYVLDRTRKSKMDETDLLKREMSAPSRINSAGAFNRPTQVIWPNM